MALAWETSASAHYVYEKIQTYESADICTVGRSEVSHGADGGGYFKANTNIQTATFTPWGMMNCGIGKRVPPGYIASYMQVYKWTSSGWAICKNLGWYYNQTTTDNVQYVKDLINPYCGSGYYALNASGYVWNGAWYGGALWSGHHLLPV